MKEFIRIINSIIEIANELLKMAFSLISDEQKLANLIVCVGFIGLVIYARVSDKIKRNKRF